MHGDRTTVDLLNDPTTPAEVIDDLTPLVRREEVIALINRRPHTPVTRTAAILAVVWWYEHSAEIARARRNPGDTPPEQHARLAEPAQALLAIEDLTGDDIVLLAKALAVCADSYHMPDQLKVLCAHPLFDVRAAYELVEHAARAAWSDHAETAPKDVIDIVEAHGYPAAITVDLMDDFNIRRMPRLFVDIAATPGLVEVLEKLHGTWTGKVSDLVKTARQILAAPGAH